MLFLTIWMAHAEITGVMHRKIAGAAPRATTKSASRTSRGTQKTTIRNPSTRPQNALTVLRGPV